MKEPKPAKVHWPRLDGVYPHFLKGVSRRGRCFHHIPNDDVPGLIGEILRDDYGSVISVTLRMDAANPGCVTVATGEIPDAWMPYDHGYAQQLPAYLHALSELLRQGEESENPQQLLAHVEGWFALTSRRTMRLPLDRRRFPALAY
ncbi:hypothetical protein [Natronospira bacteriovora]|uniref:Uncharacterized protein n=1 Tax=Natronospira bacteriovora TaxID=3069753 RepID=A0ABU0W2R7_9GAMM|nr:hypothetical protein [Natronospira sp. AB-CW4]MDQ2068304.1 hypothetical protein [Natronospira sp. AB-CW4]